MKGPSKERLEKIIDYYNNHGRDATLDEFKISSRTFIGYKCLYNKMGQTITKKKNGTIKTVMKSGQKEIIIKSYDIKELNELIEYCNVNLDNWEIHNPTLNTWGNENNPNFQVKAPLRRKNAGISFKAQLDLFREHLEKYKVPVYKPANTVYSKTGNMLEISIPDLHLGQLSWHRETGDNNYDIKITREAFFNAVDYLLSATSHIEIEKVVFLIGSDFFNVNGEANTTANGTIQDEDCRWQKSFSYGWKVVVDAVNLCKAIAPIDVLIIPGNHDTERSYYMGTVLEAWYRNDKNVNINNEPTTRKYYQWGKCLIGFEHGKDVKKDSYPIVMATECPGFSETIFREFHLGHWHRERSLYCAIDEFQGIKIRHLPSLAPRSAWEAAKGFYHIKQAKALVWHKNKGNICEFNYNI